MKAYLDQNEVCKMEAAATCSRDGLLIRISNRLGCRITEELGIEVKHIDFDRGTVTIEHLKTRLKLECPSCGARLGKTHAFCPKCGGRVKETVKKEMEHRKMRTLPLDQDTMAMLRDYVKRGGPVTKNGKTLIFGINRHRAWQIVTACARRAGLGELVNPETGRARGISPHRLRDAFAIRAMKTNDSGDGLRLLQEHLGHASFNTTAKYRKVAGEEHREWYDKLWSSERK
jgi:integrase/recombinase XerD